MTQHGMVLTIVTSLVVVLNPPHMTAQPGSWVQTNGPEGGYIGNMIVTPGGTILAGSEEGIHKSTDDGSSWAWALSAMQYRGISSLACDSSGGVLAGTGQGRIYKSTDEGMSWQLLPGSGGSIYGLCCGDSATIWLARWGVGVMRTTDEGSSWQMLDSGLVDKYVLSLFVEENGFALAGTSTGLYRTTNAGAVWAIDSVGLSNWGVYSIARHANGNIFAATNGGLFRTTDNGDTWSKVSTGSCRILLIHPSGDIYCGTFGGEARRSTDGGTVWTSALVSPVQTVCALVSTPSGGLFAGCLGRGIYLSTDNGTTWVPRKNGLVATTITSLLQAPDGFMIAGTDGAGLLRTANGGATWLSDSIATDVSKVMGLALDDSNGVLAGTWGWGLYRRSPSSTGWVRIDYGYFYSVVTSPGGLVLGCRDNGKILHSTDYGKTHSEDSVTDVAVFSAADAGNGVLYAGTHTKGVFRSSDSGKTWTQRNSGLSNLYVRVLLIREGGTILAGTDGGLFLSTDAGESWTGKTTGLFNVRAILPIGSRYIALAGWKGVSFSSDSGSTWALVNDGLWPPDLRSITIDDDGYLYAGTANAGVFRSVGTTSVGNHVASDVPISCALMQNCPNPFNPTTSIGYSVGVVSSQSSVASSHVRLAVYDMLGREVAVLVNEKKLPGKYEVQFDASGLASGAYFYRLETGTFVQTRKLLLLR